jgi:hypothetical protein
MSVTVLLKRLFPVVYIFLFCGQIFSQSSTQFTLYNNSNTQGAFNLVTDPSAIRVSVSGVVWVGTSQSGVISYDEVNTWTSYDVSSTSGFPNNYINHLFLNGNDVWASTSGYNGMGHYNGSGWSTVNQASTGKWLSILKILCGLLHTMA